MNYDRAVRWLGVAAIVFGVVTVISGGRALFGSAETRADLGNVVPFVLGFNFIAGFIYILAGVGLWRRRCWAVSLSMLLAGATVFVFASFGVQIMGGGAFEMRTVGAMTVRSLFWIIVASVSVRAVQRATGSCRKPDAGQSRNRLV